MDIRIFMKSAGKKGITQVVKEDDIADFKFIAEFVFNIHQLKPKIPKK